MSSFPSASSRMQSGIWRLIRPRDAPISQNFSSILFASALSNSNCTLSDNAKHSYTTTYHIPYAMPTEIPAIKSIMPYQQPRRFLSSARFSDTIIDNTETVKAKQDTRGKRVWKANPLNNGIMENNAMQYPAHDDHWDTAVDDVNNRRTVDESLARICEQEREGGRMQQSQLGVLREDPHDDMRLLLENYTAAALASALRDREDTLQHCATLLAHNQLDELRKILRPYEQQFIQRRRHSGGKMLDFRQGFGNHNIELLRKGLNRMPRRISTAHSKRAGVVLPLCNVDGVPCILFEKRSRQLRAHPDEVCLPGGMVSGGADKSIVDTCIREMEEEIGIGHNAATVLGVLRCNWGEVHHLVGVAVTPVVCYLGEIGEHELNPNPSEVAECFTVPLELFLDRQRWVHKKHYAPFFTGGPHIIWGLTGYIVNRFVMDIVERFDVVFEDEKC